MTTLHRRPGWRDDSGGRAADDRGGVAPEQSLSHGGFDGAVHLTEYGAPDAAELMVCLHGLGGSALNFGLLGPMLAEGRVLVPDLLGHGRSFATASDASASTRSCCDARPTVDAGDRSPRSSSSATPWAPSWRSCTSLSHPETVESLVLLDPPVPNVTRWSRDPRLTTKLAFLRLPGVAALVSPTGRSHDPGELVARQLADATPHAERDPNDCRRRHGRGDQGHQGRRRPRRPACPVPRDPRGGRAPRPPGAVAPPPRPHHHADPVAPRRRRPAVASSMLQARWRRHAPSGRSRSAAGSDTYLTSRTPPGQHVPSRSGWTDGCSLLAFVTRRAGPHPRQAAKHEGRWCRTRVRRLARPRCSHRHSHGGRRVAGGGRLSPRSSRGRGRRRGDPPGRWRRGPVRS